ncbi:MAG: protein translocase subunit SecF [Bacillota bacterium]|nr:protein translocase subunit SecF [Bacillota bacterium]
MHNFKIAERAKIWFSISLIIIVVGLGFMFTRGLNFGIDFIGGTMIQINMEKDFNKADVDTIIKKYVPADEFISTKANSNKELDIKVKLNAIKQENVTKLFNDIKTKYNLKDKQPVSTENIGATIGSELERKAIVSLSVSMILMLLFIGIRFEFRFGAAAILALVHDVLITLSVYAIGYLTIDSAFIAAILTIIGYSISDTIVIFDRIRENQKKLRKLSATELADVSISQTLKRSIYTVTTTVVATVCVHIFVPAVRNFTIPLIVGILSGCYSSIFIASPFWVILKNRANKKAAAQ